MLGHGHYISIVLDVTGIDQSVKDMLAEVPENYGCDSIGSWLSSIDDSKITYFSGNASNVYKIHLFEDKVFYNNVYAALYNEEDKLYSEQS